MRTLLLLLTLSEFLRMEVSVKDMDCASCSDSLGKTFEKMRGVKHSSINMKEGTVTLELADQNRITMEQVWDALKRVGFTPGDTKVTVRGAVKGAQLTISVMDKTIAIEGRAPEGESVELKGTIAPPLDPRTPVKLRLN